MFKSRIQGVLSEDVSDNALQHCFDMLRVLIFCGWTTGLLKDMMNYLTIIVFKTSQECSKQESRYNTLCCFMLPSYWLYNLNSLQVSFVEKSTPECTATVSAKEIINDVDFTFIRIH